MTWWGSLLSIGDTVTKFVLGEESLALRQKKKQMRQRDEIAQGMLQDLQRTGGTEVEWRAFRAYVDESVRLSNEP